jgi:hypothetical protein
MLAMKTILLLYFALFCSTTALAQQAPQQWGTILGRVVYDGKPPQPAMMSTHGKAGPNGPKEVPDESLVVGKNGGLANVFVFLRSKPSKIHPGYTESEPKKVLFEAKNGRFVPHTLGLWTHDILDYRNREPYGMNLNDTSPVEAHGLLLAAKQDHEIRYKVSSNIPRIFGCNIHPWYKANFLVRDNPYFCVTDERGIFCIPNLPENEELEFQFWHERVGYLKNMKSDVETFKTNEKGRLQTKLTQPVSDFGEFKIDPTMFKE